MRKVMLALVLGGSVSLGACAVKTAVPESTLLPTVAAGAVAWSAQPEEAWWRQFDDPVLDSLMEDARVANREVQAAAARFAAASELAGIARLGFMPWGGASAGATRRHLSEREAFGLALPGRTAASVDAGVAMRWEADLFGRMRGTARAAVADAAALQMDMRAVQVAITGQVASAYFDYRGAQREESLLTGMRQRTHAFATRTSALVAAGRLTRLELLAVQRSADALDGELADVARAREHARLRLATLTGRTPDDLRIPDVDAGALRAVSIPLASAADRIQSRPDVAGAEFRLRAAAARAGVARSQPFPRLEFTGSLGLIAGSVGQLGAASAGAWLIAPRIAWNVLDWPRLRRQMKAAGALTDAAFAEYEQTVLAALEEVRGSMDAYAAATERVRAADARAQRASRTADVLTVQHKEGMTDALSRIAAEREALDDARLANRAVTEHRQAVVGIYRAVGGAWD